MKEGRHFLVVGADGYLGSHFYSYCHSLGIPVLGTSRKEKSPYLHLDLKNPNLSFLDNHSTKPTHALVCAAIPNIIKCQKEPRTTFLTNVLGTLNLARLLEEQNIKPILFSTDVVYDGTQDAYFEHSLPTPLNEYGKQKALLEELTPQVCQNGFLIVRLTKTYSYEREDQTLLFELSKKLLNQEPIRAAKDLIFNPVSVSDVIKATFCLIEEECSGLYNICSKDSTSWYDLSLRLAKALGVSTQQITPISIDDLHSDIPRAKKINLRPDKFLNEFSEFSFTNLDQAIESVCKIIHQTSQPT